MGLGREACVRNERQRYLAGQWAEYGQSWRIVDSFASTYKCIASSNKCLTGSNRKLAITILIKFLLLLLVRHLLLLAWHLFLIASCYY